jgi:hypothetical protein
MLTEHAEAAGWNAAFRSISGGSVLLPGRRTPIPGEVGAKVGQ